MMVLVGRWLRIGEICTKFPAASVRCQTYGKQNALRSQGICLTRPSSPMKKWHIDVDTDDNGAVYLTGMANTQKEADRAMAMARKTDGVTVVTSTILVKKVD
jgi:hypothetical protein